jgi:type I restriction-modification system DNA methylase subunit
MPSAAPADSAQSRKARGAFFTPPELCDHVVDWAVRDRQDVVLEPSCGEAAFLLSAGARLRALSDGGHYGSNQLCGPELHEQSARAARLRLASLGLGAQIEIGDFFAVDPTPRFDAVVGNPPYVRYQELSGDARARSRAAALRAGASLTGLASSWAAFTVHAALFLKPGGRLGLVLPAELLSVNYAAGVRRYLMERFSRVRLVLFSERVFPGVMEEIVLLRDHARHGHRQQSAFRPEPGSSRGARAVGHRHHSALAARLSPSSRPQPESHQAWP